LLLSGYGTCQLCLSFSHRLSSQIDLVGIVNQAIQDGVGPNKLISQFKAFFGESIHNYVVKVRMKKAKGLLEESDLPITETCALVGYGDHSGFSRAFKKVYGITPSKIRRHTAG